MLADSQINNIINCRQFCLTKFFLLPIRQMQLLQFFFISTFMKTFFRPCHVMCVIAQIYLRYLVACNCKMENRYIVMIMLPCSWVIAVCLVFCIDYNFFFTSFFNKSKFFLHYIIAALSWPSIAELQNCLGSCFFLWWDVCSKYFCF